MAEYHKTCAHCGAAFVAKKATGRWCSDRCAERGRYWTDPERFRSRARDWARKRAGLAPPSSCIQCGSSMVGKRADAKFCSRRCSHRYSRGKAEEDYAIRRCTGCDVSIAHKNLNTKFCTGACKQRATRALKRAANPYTSCKCCSVALPRRKGNVKYCDNCAPGVSRVKKLTVQARYRDKPESKDKERLRYNERKIADSTFHFMTTATALQGATNGID